MHRKQLMLLTIVVAGLVSAAIAVDLAVRRSRLNQQRVALIVLGYGPLLAGIFVAGAELEGTESVLPLCAAALVGFGHAVGQMNYARAGLALQAFAALAVGVAALLFVTKADVAQAILVCSSVSILELTLVAPSDLQKL